jgi:hypothetical protein
MWAAGFLTGNRSARAIPHLKGENGYLRNAAAAVLVARDVPSDLLALADQIKTLNPRALQTAYEIAVRMTSRVHVRLPEESRASARTHLARLTRTVLEMETS